MTEHMTAMARLRTGGVIPAHPLVLDEQRRPDWGAQRALTEYYLDAGAIGLAVGVHSTQFEVRQEEGLLRRILSEAAAVADDRAERPILVAGAAGSLPEALADAATARDCGYDFMLVAPYGAGDVSEQDLVERTRAIGEILPVIAFYLQPDVGGRILSEEYWRQIADLDCVVGIKAAPFSRYRTLELLRGVARSARAQEIALYTGNDDSIIADLLSDFHLPDDDGEPRHLRFVGGLLGQWAVWTQGAVRIMSFVQDARAGDRDAQTRLLDLASDLTEANRVIFDAANGFAGCIPGIHEVLRLQGLMKNTHCLNPHEVLSPGQREAIAQAWEMYPELRDRELVIDTGLGAR
ncbi:dihydrodipicolinate synthase family protein [Microbacterium sp. SSW1-49]|uniref:Dihydrodipicolinate synthase family protein n=1 Tax=Microbacterium croceum TaxID=2851645 RepID=A0ABT0FA21_9MICO|nr:dihydrodipicolinate synthase family protein [Microbacterium croceum]MCK2034915.1 dihydrodipicolinate synthase family protein [Microbacterium croceum]